MQKVVGSSPISRFGEDLHMRVLFVCVVSARPARRGASSDTVWTLACEKSPRRRSRAPKTSITAGDSGLVEPKTFCVRVRRSCLVRVPRTERRYVSVPSPGGREDGRALPISPEEGDDCRAG